MLWSGVGLLPAEVGQKLSQFLLAEGPLKADTDIAVVSAVAVSYTHLDVYKRQKQGFASVFTFEPMIRQKLSGFYPQKSAFFSIWRDFCKKAPGFDLSNQLVMIY